MKYIEAEHDVWVDPVSHQTVDSRNSPHQSFYDGRHYHFADLTSKQTFDEDPQLWVSTSHASETSAHITTTGEPMDG